jgi:hypothetical protein
MAERSNEFLIGDHCRFCPAKLLCPAIRETADEVADPPLAPEHMTDDELAYYYQRLGPAKMFFKAVEDRLFRKFSDGTATDALKAVAKLVHKKGDREWKPETRVVDKFGLDAYQPTKVITPAMAEKLPGGKEFVAEFAFKPETGLTLAPADDPRVAVERKTDEEVFAATLQSVVDKPSSLW